MEGKRIVVMGGCGSGKSTLSRRLGDMMSIPVVHLDKLFWKAGWVSASEKEFDVLLAEAMRQDSWVMDGNYSRTLKARFERCDTVIYLDYSRVICFLSVLKRIFKSYGRPRADMGEGCPERLDFEFLRYTWNFNKNFRSQNLTLLNGLRDKKIYIFRSRRECRGFLKNLS